MAVEHGQIWQLYDDRSVGSHHVHVGEQPPEQRLDQLLAAQLVSPVLRNRRNTVGDSGQSAGHTGSRSVSLPNAIAARTTSAYVGACSASAIAERRQSTT
ncbi:MAG TPA: hypothetical protein VFO07_08030 [Roseiflexaceae bacterium]|nr:hypothetical protein [Roseiflexaceae bacterium]